MTLVPNSNAEAFLSHRFGSTLEPCSGCRDENAALEQAEERNWHHNRQIGQCWVYWMPWEPGDDRPSCVGVPANCTEKAVPVLRPVDGWLVWEPREHVGWGARWRAPAEALHFCPSALGSIIRLRKGPGWGDVEVCQLPTQPPAGKWKIRAWGEWGFWEVSGNAGKFCSHRPWTCRLLSNHWLCPSAVSSSEKGQRLVFRGSGHQRTDVMGVIWKRKGGQPKSLCPFSRQYN